MPIQTEVWASDIKEQLVPDNSFMAESNDDSVWVKNHKVHKPQAGAFPNVEENRVHTGAGVNANLRTDTDLEYNLNEYTSDPTKIPNIEEVEVSYPKRISVLRGHVKAINKKIANRFIYEWLPTLVTSMVRTSGDAIAAAIPSATGNRKKITPDDINAAALILDEQDIPADGRCILMPAYMYRQLVKDHWKDLLVLQKEGDAVLNNGHITMLFGFKIYRRSTKNMPFYSNAATPVRQAVGTTLTTGNGAALCWHPEFVSRALGEVKFFETLNSAKDYGDIYSALARANGSKEYSNQIGVVAIVEAHGA